MRLERTKNTVRNTVWGIINNVVGIILPFVIRTIILYLSRELLGLSSLFSSVLGMLNLADLGFGSAVVFSMYKPIAEDNTEQICALLALYRKIYRIIGCVIMGAGLVVTPFIRHLINGSCPDRVNIYIIFVIELVNTSISYFFFGYKEVLLQAHQRTDITSKVLIVVRTLKYAVQILLLVLFKNYYLYIIAAPVFTLILNYINYRAATKYYPQYVCRGKITAKQRKDITKQVGGLMISKICGVTRNGLDNIVLSSFIGLAAVAMYGNYYYLLISVHTILGVLGTSMRAGIGNSIAGESVEKNYNDMRKFTFLYAWIAGFCTCCFVGLYQPFIQLWVGAKNLFPIDVMLLFSLYFYLMTATDVRNTYIDATGIWWSNRMRPIIETLMNLVLNIGLGYLFGVRGIIIATIVSLTIVNLGYGSKVLFDKYFIGFRLRNYLQDHLAYFVVTALACAATYGACALLPSAGFIAFVEKGIVCLILPNVFFALAYCKNSQFKYVFTTAKSVLNVASRGRKLSISNKSGKQESWQFVRGVSMLAIVLIHCASSIGKPFLSLGSTYYFFVRSWLSFPVAVLFYVSGRFVKKPKDGRWSTYIFKRIKRLGIPYLIFSTVYILFGFVTGNRKGVLQIVKTYLTGDAAMPFYFTVVLLYFTCLTPLLARWVNKRFLSVLLPVITLAIQGAAFVFSIRGMDIGWVKFTPVWLLFYYWGMKAGIGEKPVCVSLKKSLMLVGTTYLIQLAEVFVLLQYPTLQGLAWSQWHLTAFLFAGAMVLLAEALSISSFKFPRLLVMVGDNSYGIYFLHCLFLAVYNAVVLRLHLVIQLPFVRLSQFVFSVVGSLVIVFIIHRVIPKKFSEKYLGI